MDTLAIIPARAGSKGIPDKNIVKVNGKTLIEIAIKVGLDCSRINDVYISTDSAEYNEIALKAGARSLGLRRTSLSDDNAKTVDVVIDLIQSVKKQYDYLVLLQPSSPVRNAQDICEMMVMLDRNQGDACVSVTKLDEPHPFKLKSIDEEGFLKPFMDGKDSESPRQSLPAVYALNGAIYIIKVDTLFEYRTFFPPKTLPYFMDLNINIDNEEDLIFLKAMEKLDKIRI